MFSLLSHIVPAMIWARRMPRPEVCEGIGLMDYSCRDSCSFVRLFARNEVVSHRRREREDLQSVGAAPEYRSQAASFTNVRRLDLLLASSRLLHRTHSPPT